ncbi:D-amino acid dehydrogenase [Madurella mycetomatis]|uniref:D-amino acid dehydrogenase n=1 Tax=Madurella mycetomatis TaxID=100816 RepID=A0A175VVX3_9PEZI|nr:D-amino acid dehydrogenase [Madurella mycetomatis]
MDERAKIPVSLPHENPTQSYWQDPPDAIADLHTTSHLPSSADTVIIGSGITGAAVAWGLLRSNPDPGSIVMLEARQACSGATGRNVNESHCVTYQQPVPATKTYRRPHKSCLVPHLPAHVAAHGVVTARQIAELELANILAVHAFAREHAIACDLQSSPTVDIVYDAAEWVHARAAIAAMRTAFPTDHPAAAYTLHTADEARRHFFVTDGRLRGREEAVCGAVEYFGGSLSAYAFGIGVLKLCLGKGLNLQTGTPVVELGVVRARRVVLATNGYTAAIAPRFQGVVVPLRGQVTAQRPGKGMPFGGCLPTTYSFIYEKGYEYMVTRPEGSLLAGDVIMGGGLLRLPDEGLMEFGTTDDTTVNEWISAYLRDTTPRYFGDNWGEDDPAGRVRKEWTGIMGFSPDGFPLVGEVPGEEGLWASCGFQGHGMVLCWMCARALVDMMEGRDGEQLREWFPDVFRITEERLALRFEGHSHTTAGPENE